MSKDFVTEEMAAILRTIEILDIAIGSSMPAAFFDALAVIAHDKSLEHLVESARSEALKVRVSLINNVKRMILEKR